MQDDFSVSVVIPLYNAKDTIINAVQSVLLQSFAVKEIIIIDDGSSDDSANVVRAFIAKNKSATNIKLICTKNAGASSARNVGIKNASCNFIAFLDSDDAWHKEKMQKQINALQKFPNASIVSTSSTVKKRFTNKTRAIPYLRLLMQNHVVTSSCLVKAELAKKFLFEEKLSRAEDYNLWLKIARFGDVIFIDEKLVFFADKCTFGESGLSKDFHRLMRDEYLGHKMLLRQKFINLPQYLFAICMTSLKYLKKCAFVYVVKRIKP